MLIDLTSTSITNYSLLSISPSLAEATTMSSGELIAATQMPTSPSSSLLSQTAIMHADDAAAEYSILPFLSDNDRLLLYLRYYARHFIPIFCLVGIVGNCMALMLIKTNYWLRRLTSNIYLCTLSICGCLFLTTVMVTWLDSTFGFPLYSSSELGCKMFTFVAHACDFICVWMISWVSCDRAIVLFRPGIRRRVCSKKFARNLVIASVLFSSTLYGWCLVFAGLEPAGGDGGGGSASYCGLNSDIQLGGYNLRQLHTFFSLLDTILCMIVPSLLIMVVNSLSIFRYRQCMKIYASGVLRVRFLKVPETEERKLVNDETTTAKKFLLSQTNPTTNQLATNASSSRSTNGGKLKSSDLTLSRSLLIVTSTFVLLNVPNYLCRLYEAVFIVEPGNHLWQLTFFTSYLLYYLHHAVLFYMYIFWSPQMKKQLMPTALKLLECYCFKTVPEFGHHYHKENQHHSQSVALPPAAAPSMGGCAANAAMAMAVRQQPR